MAQVKPVLYGSTINTFASDAQVVITYYVDFSDTDAGGYTPTAMLQAILQVPQIGNVPPISLVPGAPGNVHYMRVMNHNVRTTSHTSKYFIDVVCGSRPKPSREFGSSGVQSRSSTYIKNTTLTPDLTPTNPLAQARDQMVLSWKATAGIWGQDLDTGVMYPPTDMIEPRVPVSATALRFGATMRLAATYYSDELAEAVIIRMGNYFTPTTNAADLFYVGDRGYWLCSTCNASSSDGGYTNRVSAEWVFNADGWDTVAVYTDSWTNQLAILDPKDVAACSVPLIAIDSSGIPLPVYGKNKVPSSNSGIARFPQISQVDHLPLKALLYQSRFGGANSPNPKDIASDFVQGLSTSIQVVSSFA